MVRAGGPRGHVQPGILRCLDLLGRRHDLLAHEDVSEHALIEPQVGPGRRDRNPMDSLVLLFVLKD